VTALENIKPGSRLRGLDPSEVAEVVQVTGFGTDALNVVFRANGRVGERLVMRGEGAGFEFAEAGRTYALDADGGLLRLASEADWGAAALGHGGLWRDAPASAARLSAIGKAPIE
jgi:hypothetical protein